PPSRVPIMLGVKGPRALALAAEIADGVHCSILASPAHVRRVRATTAGARGDFKVIAYVPVAVSDDGARARQWVRPLVAHYLGLLHGQSILEDAGIPAARSQPFRESFIAGRAAAADLVTNDLLDAVAIAGTPAECRSALERWAEAGLDAVIAVVPEGGGLARQIERVGGERSPAGGPRRGRCGSGAPTPTCIEGMMSRVPFARPEDILRTAQLAERVGFDSVWGNDHMTTQRYVQREWPQPPNFYEPLITFTWVAARTERIKLATGIIVLPMRTMPVLAKQVATLDQLSGGRVMLGVGTGAYREEYEALCPDGKDARRGEIVDEGMRALRLLFTERKATFHGRHVRFEAVECFPKPRQAPLPLYAGGNHPEVRRRAGAYAEGWMPAVLSPEEIARGVQDVRRAADKAGPGGAPNRLAPPFACSIGRPAR